MHVDIWNLRALSSGVLNVLNAIIFGIWHVKLQNMSFIRCSICVIFLEHATVRSHIWKRTVHLYYNLYYFFILAGPTATVSLSPLSSLCLLISFTEMYQLSLSHFISLLSLSLSLSLLHVTASLSDKTQAGASSHVTPRHTNPIYTLRSPSTNTATQTRPTTSTTTHGLITMPRHAAELVVPSTTLSEPPTIGFLLIGLQWWVLLLGLFDLGCGFVWFGCVFCRADLSSCVCVFFFF